MTCWAVFDVDGTLLPQISMEGEFLNYLIREKLLPFKNLVYCFLKGLTAFISRGWIEAAKSNKAYLKGLSVSTVDKYSESCFYQHIGSALSQRGKQKVEALRQEGYKILIISGAPVFLARHLKPVYNPHYVVCTEVEIRNGYYSGKITGMHPYGKRKKFILESMQRELDIDFNKSIVFADHHADVYHMKLFGRAAAVNATPKLRKAALQYGWEILVWD